MKQLLPPPALTFLKPLLMSLLEKETENFKA